MKALLTLILGALFLVSSHAQNITGMVFEKIGSDSVSPLPGVHVFYPNTDVGTVTDISGKFSIKKTDQKNLVFSFIGYANDTVKITGDELTIVMESGNILEGLTVEIENGGYRLSRFDAMMAHTMDQKEIRKAACCNLGESFETNPSIDASYTDAISGTKQIRMLGLSGKYVQIMQDNMPLIRGLATVYGLEYVPGSWINSIYISKGAGSVVNGYESMTGQINIDWKKPNNAEKFHLNLFQNQGGRSEFNGQYSTKVGKKWESTALIHGRTQFIERDNNNDGFLDMPIGRHVIAHNQWNYRGENLRMEFGVGYVDIENRAGQFGDSSIVNPYLFTTFSSTKRLKSFAKIGYLFPDEDYKSLAIQTSFIHHDHSTRFGTKAYAGVQSSGYANVIFQDEIGEEEEQTYRTGVSFVYDNYQEKLYASDTVGANHYNLEEMVPGAYFEYGLNKANVSFTGGIRADYNTVFGAFVTPRLHFRYNLDENTTIKLAGGSGRRTPNIVMENVGLLATSRNWVIENDPSIPGYGLKQEVAWNIGFAALKEFRLLFREASVMLDLYRTEFQNQIIVDLDEDPQTVFFYNLNGQSYSNSAQLEFSYDLSNRFDVRLAYRYLDVKKTFKKGLLTAPLLASHRAFMNVAYESRKNDKEGQWKADATLQWIGEQRIPFTGSNPEIHQRPTSSEAYFLVNAQITKAWSPLFEIYLGGENLLNFTQNDPIISANNPFSDYFDSSLIWAPIFGRNIYIGLRWTIE